MAALSHTFSGTAHRTVDAIVGDQPLELLTRIHWLPRTPFAVCQAAIRVALISLRRCVMNVKTSLQAR